MKTKTQQSQSVKAFVNNEGGATITCPACGLSRTISADNFRHKQHVLGVKCKCSITFKVHLEFRKTFRKPTELEAFYSLLPPASGGGRAKIVNISRSGIGFLAVGVHSIRPAQIAQLKFTLDNKNATQLDKRVKVKYVKDNYIGGQFLEDQPLEKELGFYLTF